MITRMEKHGDCVFAAVSDTGISHRISHMPNQDAVDFIAEGDDFALAVSDGVGSCKMAEKGSGAAVSAVKEVFLKLKGKILTKDTSYIAESIISEWNRLLCGEVPDDCCATLKAAIKLGDRLLLFSVGDGLLAVSSEGTQIRSASDDGLFGNQTLCLNEDSRAGDFQVLEMKLDTQTSYAVFACSDGVADYIQEGREMELVAEIETIPDGAALLDELEGLIIELSELSLDDRTAGVVKYERSNAESGR